ncbi:MAG: glyoxalase/bleomycin resistance/extradiol dioxygenase family protein [Polyangiaceae bacterium]
MSRQVFINLPVKDLGRAKAFWESLGFSFNAQFTDDKGACLVFGESGYAMLLTEPFFRTFTKREICDTKTHIEGIFALSCESRAEVDAMITKIVAAGGEELGSVQDHGFMYLRAFADLDRHHWEVFWMDPSFVQK